MCCVSFIDNIQFYQITFMKQTRILSEKTQNPLIKPSSSSRHAFTPYQRPSLKSQSKSKINPTPLRSNTLSLARKIESSLTKVRSKESHPKTNINKAYSVSKSAHSSKSHSHFNSVNENYHTDTNVRSFRKTESSKPKTQREDLRRIIQSLKQKEQNKVYKELDKKYPSSKTMNVKGRAHESSVNKSVNVEIEQPLSLTYSYRTQQGILATNPSKPNQDSLLIKSKVCGQNNHLFAVADGHGVNGHHVSQFVAKNLSKLLESSMKALTPTESFKVTFNKLQQSLKQSQVNAQCSGTTLVSLLIKKNHLYCANVGDSRAIIVSQNKNKSWEISQLSRDHKPDLPDEKQRILKCGGRVEPFKDEKGNSLGPMRVWLPKQNLQGLAMSRSIGDNVSKAVGVTCQPQIINYRIQQKDKFIIIGSDGLWQFIDNEEAARTILPYYKQNKIEQGIGALVKLANSRWTSEDSSVVDDITVILIFLHK